MLWPRLFKPSLRRALLRPVQVRSMDELRNFVSCAQVNIFHVVSEMPDWNLGKIVNTKVVEEALFFYLRELRLAFSRYSQSIPYPLNSLSR